MSRADGKAERDRIEAERAVREAIAAKQSAAQSSCVPKQLRNATEELLKRPAKHSQNLTR